MQPTSKSNSGFALLELIAVVVIVGLIALAGLKVYGAHKNSVASESAATNTSSQESLKSAAATVPQVKSSADLDKASKVLDQNDPDSTNANDSAQLDNDANDL
jgi:prepilin-type N-terminal cleavage/methylation domain-containing protein